MFFHKISIPLPQKCLFLRSKAPTPLEIPIQLHTFLLIFFGPTDHPGDYNSFCKGSKDFIWNCTIYRKMTDIKVLICLIICYGKFFKAGKLSNINTQKKKLECQLALEISSSHILLALGNSNKLVGRRSPNPLPNET